MTSTKPLALYPVRTKTSYWTKFGLMTVFAALALLFLVPKLFEFDYRQVFWQFSVLSLLFVLLPLLYWIATSGQRVGTEGEVKLYRERLCIPSGDSEMELPLDTLSMEQSTSSAGIGFGGIPVGSMEYGRCLQFRSAGKKRKLDINAFIDSDHFRQLVEDVQVVRAGGTPDGSAAYLAGNIPS